MGDRVKRRSYDNRTRTSASQQRRSQVLTAARELFLELGYVRTTMAGVAANAGVSIDTVYELVGRKPELFRLLIEAAISGEDRAVPAEERAYVQQIRAEATAAGKLRIYAEALPSLLARLAPLVTLAQAAAFAEPQVADLWHEIGERRAQNMKRFARELADTGQLAVPVDQAADVIWATNSTELYVLLVEQRSWAPAAYSRWLADTWQRLLLQPSRPPADTEDPHSASTADQPLTQPSSPRHPESARRVDRAAEVSAPAPGAGAWPRNLELPPPGVQ